MHRAVVLPKSGLLVKKLGEVDHKSVISFGEFQIKWLNTKVEECCLWGYSEESAVVSATLLGEGLWCV